MEPCSLMSILTEEEVQSLPEEIKDKLESILKVKHNEFAEQKSEFEKLRVLSDQQCFDLEKQLETSTSNLESEQAKSRCLEVRNVELETKLEESRVEHSVLKETISNYSSELESVKRRDSELTTEVKELLHILEKRNAEVEQLKEEIKAITKQYTTANQAKLETLLKLDEVSACEVALQRQVKRLENEKDGLKKEVENLTTEVSQSVNSLYATRTEQAHKVLELQSKLDNVNEELSLAKDVKESLQRVVEEQNSKLEKMLEQLKDEREMNIKAESQFSHELQSQIKLTNLYKGSLEESQCRTKELMAAVEEMQNLLKQAVEENNKLQETISLEKSNYKSIISENEKQVNKLDQELVKANHLINQMRKHVLSESDVENLSPSAAAASRLLKSGKTLTEIYADYIDLTDQLQVEKDTNARLNMYLAQILKEIEDKAPCLKKQRDDYEKSLETLSLMTQQLNKSVAEHEALEASVKEADRNCRLLKQENEALRKSCDDLGQQVCCLLKQVEEAAGTTVIDEDPSSTNVVSSTVTNADSAISDNLVIFRNLKELQCQNQKLLVTIRELSEKREQEENDACDKKVSELREKLDEATKEITELREFHNKHCEMVKSLVRQRDMYRVLLSQTSDGKELEFSVAGNGDAKSPKKLPFKDDSTVALQQLQEDFNAYKSTSSENQTILVEQLDKLKEERMELRLLSSKLSSQLEFTTERYNTLKSSSEGYKREISVLRTRNEQLSNLSAKHEETVVSLRNELRAMQDKLSRAEVSVENLRQERLLLKQVEARLHSENESLARERSGQAMVLTNLQAIQNNLEKSESDSKALIANRIAALEKEVSALQSKLDREHERSQSAAQSWEKERQEFLNKLQAEIDKTSKTRDELVSAYSTVHELRQEALTKDEKIKSLETLVTRGRQGLKQATAPSKSVNGQDKDDISLQLKEANAEISNLKAQLKKSNEHLLQFKAMSSSLEDEIKQQNQASKKFQEETEKLLNSKSNVISEFEKELGALKQENDKLLKEKHNALAENLAKANDGRKELQKATIDLQNALQALEDCKKSEQEARQEFQAQTKLLKEAQDKYEREVLLHATDLKSLEEIRKKFQQYEEKQATIEEVAKKAEFALRDGMSSWKEQEKVLKDQVGHLEGKCNALEEQNSLLHEQMEKLSGQMITLQSKEGSNLSLSFEGSTDESIEHLMEIIKYLRKEKEIATTKCDVIVAENERLTTKGKFLEKRLDENERLLRELQEKEQVTLATAGQHAELMRRVELLNVLTDGNRVLRDEKMELTKKIQEVETKVAQLESEVGPLKERNQELVAQYDAVYAERKALEGEAKRWQTRTQQLVEQSNRSNNEEFKKAIQERDQCQKQLGAAKEEISRLKVEVSSLEASVASLRKEMDTLKNELQAKTKDVTRISGDLEVKINELVEVNKNLQQVRKIGRKYKAQFDELKLQFDDLKVQFDEQKAQSGDSSKGQETSTSEPTVNLTEALEAAKEETRQEMETKLKESEQKLNASQEKVKKLRQTAYTRITQLSKIRDDQLKELQELRTKFAQYEGGHASNSKTEMELRINNLESQLTDARNRVSSSNKERDDLKKEVEDLNLKFTQHQKQVESLQKQLKDASNKLSSSSSSSRDSSILAQPSSDTGTPPTANIKPMATPGGSVVRHPHPSGVTSRQTPMGRIRPISAVSPAATRTAAVIPTTASVNLHMQHQESLDDVHPSPTVTLQTTTLPQATVAPTPAVAISSISAVVHDAPQQNVALHHHSSHVEESLVAASDANSNIGGIVDEKPTMHVPTELSSGVEDLEIPQIASPDREQGPEFADQESLKRQREDLEGETHHDGFSGTSKKRICTEEPSREVPQSGNLYSDIPLKVVQASVQPSTSRDDDGSDVLQKMGGKVRPDVDEEQEVILVDSDDDDENGRMGTEDVEGVEDEEDERSISDNYDDDDDQNNDEFQDDTANTEEDHFRDPNDEEGEGEDNDVEIIEHTEEEVESNLETVQQTEREEPTTTPSQSSHVMFLPRPPARSERFPPSLSRQQPMSYSSMASNTGFEDGDSIVPSTPTLFDPRRNDGFAEAVSSPHVPPERFLFGSNVETPSQLASQGALGVDDTRMDLTQFDEGSGRSVPSTPLQVSPLDNTNTDIPSDILGETPSTSVPRSQPDDVGQVQGSVSVPAITVTSEDDVVINTSAPSSFAESSELVASPLTGEPETEDFQQAASEGPIIVAVSSLETIERTTDSAKNQPDPGTSGGFSNEAQVVTTDVSSPSNPPEKEGTSNQQSEQLLQRRTTPIIWDSPRPPIHGRPNPRGGQHMNRPFVRRSRPPPGLMQPHQRMGYRNMGRGGRMPPRGRPYPRQRQ